MLVLRPANLVCPVSLLALFFFNFTILANIFSIMGNCTSCGARGVTVKVKEIVPPVNVLEEMAAREKEYYDDHDYPPPMAILSYNVFLRPPFGMICT